MVNRRDTWTAKQWLLLIGFSFAGIALTACGQEAVAPTPPQNVIVNVNVNQNIGVTPSPSPGGTAKGPVASVTMQGFPDGEHCTPPAQPANQTKTIGVGCYLDATINPRDASGAVIFDTGVTGTEPEAFVRRDEFTGATVTQDGTNRYNFRITCTAAGNVVLSATVKGVSSGDVTFTCK